LATLFHFAVSNKYTYHNGKSKKEWIYSHVKIFRVTKLGSFSTKIFKTFIVRTKDGNGYSMGMVEQYHTHTRIVDGYKISPIPTGKKLYPYPYPLGTRQVDQIYTSYPVFNIDE
jgi:hypothetical protein